MFEKPVRELVVLVAQRSLESPGTHCGECVIPRCASFEALDSLRLCLATSARRRHGQSEARVHVRPEFLVTALREGVGRASGRSTCPAVGLGVVPPTCPFTSFAVGKKELVVVGLTLDEPPQIRVASGQALPELTSCRFVRSDLVFGAFGSCVDDGHGLSPGDRFFGLFRQE
jgi:hypothetical protein